MNALERIGLLKMDFLGLTTLTVLHDTVLMIEKNRGAKIDIDNLALDDPETYKLFARGETTAIFQFESHACATFSVATNRPASKISPPSTRCTVPAPSRAA